MIKVVHIITGLGVGGAESMLFKLVTGLDKTEFDCYVISLSGHGPIGDKMTLAGIKVEYLDMKPSSVNPGRLMRLSRRLREIKPDVIQTWMYHSDLIGGIAARISGNCPLIWNIRHSRLPSTLKRTTLLIGRIAAFLSDILPNEIVCCSEAARRDHIELGYPEDRLIVIPNGFDLGTHAPSPNARKLIRDEIKINDTTPLIGMIGRFDPLKDHENFATAAGILHRIRPEVCFLLCGDGISAQNSDLVGYLEKSRVRDCTALLGHRSDIHDINAALDLATLSSYSEGFPNVLGEAMACGVPCVATDAGDSRVIVGAAGIIVPPRNPEALSEGWSRILGASPGERQKMGTAARQRIESQFSIQAVVGRYANLYKKHTVRRNVPPLN